MVPKAFRGVEVVNLLKSFHNHVVKSLFNFGNHLSVDTVPHEGEQPYNRCEISSYSLDFHSDIVPPRILSGSPPLVCASRVWFLENFKAFLVFVIAPCPGLLLPIERVLLKLHRGKTRRMRDKGLQ